MKNRTFLCSWVPVLLCGMLLCSCGMRKAATAVTADISHKGMIELESEEDVFVARADMLPLIKIMEVLHDGDAHNKKFLSLLTKATGSYAFGFAELEAMRSSATQAEWSARAKRFYLKGMNYGFGALSKKKPLNEITNAEFEKLIKNTGKKDAEIVFWTAFNWGSYINMSRDDISVAADLPRVQQMVDRVVAVNPDYMCGIAYAFKGALLAGNPLITGAKPEVARPEFEKAMSMCDGNFLFSKVLYAEWFLKAVNDNVGFKKALEDVISADSTKLPKYRLTNELAKERAKLLLAKTK